MSVEIGLSALINVPSGGGAADNGEGAVCMWAEGVYGKSLYPLLILLQKYNSSRNSLFKRKVEPRAL